jgi:hypothetical protein
VEADDAGLYVLKFRGAGQGVKALIAELIAGELVRAAGLAVPEIVLMELDGDLARTEPDPEIQHLIRASAGLNLALDYLPGSVTFDPIADQPVPLLASCVVWMDAYLSNVDRTARNANLLMWHRKLWLIDHGAALYFHHAWDGNVERAGDPFPRIRDHILLRFAASLEEADAALSARITRDIIREVVGQVPASWLTVDSSFASPEQARAAYTGYLARRLESPRMFFEEILRARS